MHLKDLAQVLTAPTLHTRSLRISLSTRPNLNHGPDYRTKETYLGSRPGGLDLHPGSDADALVTVITMTSIKTPAMKTPLRRRHLPERIP